MPSSSAVQLPEDTIDDLLYCARAGLLSDLQEAVSELCANSSSTPDAVLAATVDSNTGNTVLHMAAANGHDEIVTYVLSHFPPAPKISSDTTTDSAPSADSPSPPTPTPHFINAANLSLSTALHWSALNGHLAITRTLADAGADLTLENAAKHDALDEAERAGKQDVVRFLMARLSGKTEEEVDRIEKEAKRIEKEEEEKERAGAEGMAATQEDLEKLGLENGEDEGGVKV